MLIVLQCNKQDQSRSKKYKKTINGFHDPVKHIIQIANAMPASKSQPLPNVPGTKALIGWSVMAVQSNYEGYATQLSVGGRW